MEREPLKEGIWTESGEKPRKAGDRGEGAPRAGWGQIWRLFLLQSSRNERTMDALGFFAVVEPLLRRWARAGEDPRAAARRHLGYFNAGLYLSSAVAGVVVSLEEKRARGEEMPPERIERIKAALSSVLAARANCFFEGLLIPLGLTISCISAIYTSYLGLAIFLVLYNLYHFRSRICGYSKGFELGEGVGGSFVSRLFKEERVLGAFAAFASGVFAALLFVRAGGAGGAGFLVWGAIAFAGSALLKRRLSFPWSVVVVSLATALYLVVYPYVMARLQ